jgi:hypothetical protein
VGGRVRFWVSRRDMGQDTPVELSQQKPFVLGLKVHTQLKEAREHLACSNESPLGSESFLKIIVYFLKFAHVQFSYVIRKDRRKYEG